MGCVIGLSDIWRYLSRSLIFGLSDIWRYLAMIWWYLAAGAFALGPVNCRPGDVVGCRRVVVCRLVGPGFGVLGGRHWRCFLVFGSFRAVGELMGCVQSREINMCAPRLPRFFLLLSFSDTLLVVPILGIVYDCHL